MTLGSQIAAYRKKLSITQETLAQQLGVTNQAVSKWEADQCCPDVMLLPKLAEIFGISIDTLFGREIPAAAAALPWANDDTLHAVLFMGHRLVKEQPASREITFRYDGDALNVQSDFSVCCGDIAGNAEANGSIHCGDIEGNARANGTLNCGDIEGDAQAGGNVNSGDIEGNVRAGGSVTCGDVSGNVTAGGEVNCGDVEGCVMTGSTACGAGEAEEMGAEVTAKVQVTDGEKSYFRKWRHNLRHGSQTK